jgi:steroid delta-isomerase-like uncharacterized protein
MGVGDAVANKLLLRRFYAEVFNAGNAAAADRFIARDYVEHSPFSGQPRTLDGFKKGFTQHKRAFPNLRFQVEDMIAEGDRVMARWVVTGTHRGAFMGMKPTGRSFRVNGVDIIRLSKGKAVEHWGFVDEMALMRQLKGAPR